MTTCDSYEAFISYRHLKPDDDIAHDLYFYLLTFELPKSLRKKYFGKKTSIRPVYLDDEYMQVGDHLEDALREKLRVSNKLIVVCTGNSLKENDYGILWQRDEYLTFKEMHTDFRHYGRIIPLKVDDACYSGWLVPLISSIKFVEYRRKRQAYNEISASLLGIPAPELYEAVLNERLGAFAFRLLKRMLNVMRWFIIVVALNCLFKGQHPMDMWKLASCGIYPNCVFSYAERTMPIIRCDNKEVFESWDILCKWNDSLNETDGNRYRTKIKLEDGEWSPIVLACKEKKREAFFHIYKKLGFAAFDEDVYSQLDKCGYDEQKIELLKNGKWISDNECERDNIKYHIYNKGTTGTSINWEEPPSNTILNSSLNENKNK